MLVVDAGPVDGQPGSTFGPSATMTCAARSMLPSAFYNELFLPFTNPEVKQGRKSTALLDQCGYVP